MSKPTEAAEISTTCSSDSAQSSAPVPVPLSIPDTNAPPPFLCKTYDMVDDPSTDGVVSWSSGNNSFVIWSPPEFGRDLLPKHFKHNNFSSFVRQLNTYGFRKVQPDRWEFAHEGFLRGQKHLLKTIKRRKASHGPIQQPLIEQHPQLKIPAPYACVEVGKSGLEEDVEMLKREKNVLMQELVKLRQKQQASDKQLLVAMDRLQVMDQRHQQLMSFLAKAVQSPGFFNQFVQHQAQNNRRINEANKKRRLKQDGDPVDDSSSNPGGQIVKYQPFLNDKATSFSNMMMEADNSSQIEFRNNDQDNFALGDASSSTNWQYGDSSKDKADNYSIPEILASSAQFSTTPASVIPTCGSPADAVDVQSSGLGSGSGLGSMVQFPHVSPLVDEHAKVQSEPDISSFMDMVPESTPESFRNDSIQFNLFANNLEEDLFNIENILPAHESTDMSAYVDVWKTLEKELGLAQLNEVDNESKPLLVNDELDISQNIGCITDQIGLLSSSAKTSDSSISVQHNEF